MQIQPQLTVQIMIRGSGDFINTLAYTLHHMSWAGWQNPLVIYVIVRL